MKYCKWNDEKNAQLQRERGISFELVNYMIETENILAVFRRPNQEKYPGQKIFVIDIDNYAYLVPFVEDEETLFLKTIIPSRKATRKYLGKK